MQGPIDAVLAIMREHQLEAGQIQRIEVAVLEAGWGIVAEPRDKKYNPESVVDAQFSMPFGAAIAALDGAAGLAQFTAEKARSPRVREMMNKVVMVKDPRIEETFPQEWPARVSHRTRKRPDASKSSSAIPRAIPRTRSPGTKWRLSSARSRARC